MCNLNDFSRASCFFLLGGLGGGVPIENVTPTFLFSKKKLFLNIMVACDQQEKVLSIQKVITVNLSRNKILNLKVC